MMSKRIPQKRIMNRRIPQKRINKNFRPTKRHTKGKNFRPIKHPISLNRYLVQIHKPLQIPVTYFQPGSIFPTRVILACDENYMYIQFWELIAWHWKHFHHIQPTLFFIGSSSAPISRSNGDVIVFNPLPGIPTSFMAQVIRLLGPAMFPNDICIVSDIDLFLLNRDFLKSYLNGIPQNTFVSLNRYPSKMGRLSICYQVAKGQLFADIFGCNGTRSHIIHMIQQWVNLSTEWGIDENILTQSLIRWITRDSQHKWFNIHTPHLWGEHYNNRSISRYYHNGKYDENLLKQHYYFEFEPIRPLMSHLEYTRRILTTAIPEFYFPSSFSYLGHDTGKSRHPWDNR
jgi:hypothetical protein